MLRVANGKEFIDKLFGSIIEIINVNELTLTCTYKVIGDGQESVHTDSIEEVEKEINDGTYEELR